MRLFALTSLSMLAFAGNSVLNRMALADGDMGPASFAMIRVIAGAIALGLLIWMRHGAFVPKVQWRGAGALVLYLLGFSFAYQSLDAGVGALILFGGVQITMFAGAVIGGEAVTTRRWIGAGLAMGGLVYLLWPSGTVAVSLGGSGLMALAAIGWGVYSLLGRGAGDPLRLTGENFICAAPVVGLVWLIWPDDVALFGAVLAVLSGVVTSGLGYALWYRVLPQLDASIAAIVQLSVPIFAVLGGMALLGEPVTLRFVIASALVLGGILISLIRRA